jgi:hypothetical protein
MIYDAGTKLDAEARGESMARAREAERIGLAIDPHRHNLLPLGGNAKLHGAVRTAAG